VTAYLLQQIQLLALRGCCCLPPWSPAREMRDGRNNPFLENRGTDEKYTNGYVHYTAARPFFKELRFVCPWVPAQRETRVWLRFWQPLTQRP
jgi:hypothetical protein